MDITVVFYQLGISFSTKESYVQYTLAMLLHIQKENFRTLFSMYFKKDPTLPEDGAKEWKLMSAQLVLS